MADLWGQFDNGYSGGSDIWDNDLVGKILLDDYFEFVTPSGHIVRVWMGASWQDALVVVWNGTEWTPGVAKVWNGTDWV